MVMALTGQMRAQKPQPSQEMRLDLEIVNGIEPALFLAEAAFGTGSFIDQGDLSAPKLFLLPVDGLQEQVQVGGIHITISHYFIIASAAKHPAILVLPVPPLPLRTTTSFMQCFLDFGIYVYKCSLPLWLALRQCDAFGVQAGNLPVERYLQQYRDVL